MKAAHPEVLAVNRVNPGETLRQARESNGWSLADVALKLNLTAGSLGHLEAGDFDKLPGHTFARGYIRAYAKLLGMEQIALVQAFDHYTGTDAQGSNVHSLERIEEPVRVSHTILRFVSLLLLVVVVGGGFFWWQDQGSLRGKDVADVNLEHVEVESADGTTQIHQLDEPEDQAAAEGKTEAVAQAQINLVGAPEPVETAIPSGVSPAPAPAPAPVPAPSAHVAVAPAHGVAVVAPPVAPVAPAAPAVAPVASVPAPVVGAGNIHLKFTADCWTQVTDANGKVLMNGIKRKGDTLEVSGKSPLTLRLGFARGAQVAYNGQPVDVAPFTTGETARLKLGQ